MAYNNVSRNELSVQYAYCGDKIVLGVLPPIPVVKLSHHNEVYNETRKFSMQELGSNIRFDASLLKQIASITGIADRPTSIKAQVDDAGSGYIVVDYDATVDMSRFTVPFAATRGIARRIANIKTSYWTPECREATGMPVMPDSLAQQLLSTTDSIIKGFVSGAGAMIRWEATVTEARKAITSLQALGIPIPAELQARANMPKPTLLKSGTVKHSGNVAPTASNVSKSSNVRAKATPIAPVVPTTSAYTKEVVANLSK